MGMTLAQKVHDTTFSDPPWFAPRRKQMRSQLRVYAVFAAVIAIPDPLVLVRTVAIEDRQPRACRRAR
jgi:hypothetical protein